MLRGGGLLAAAALLGLAVAPRLGRLRQRYDRAALSPIVSRPAADPGDEALKQRLTAWAAEGAGSGATLLPWSAARVPLAFACLHLPAAAENAVHHFGYRLAGYHQLDERSRVGGLLYRIGTQLRPLAWFLPRRPDEPWDDAWLSGVDEAQLAALAAWQPRRPTLVVLVHPSAALAARLEALLNAAARHAEHPVRLLIVDADDEGLRWQKG